MRLAPSCSLLHVPYSAEDEERLDARVRPWLAFGQEKLSELQLLKAALGADGETRRELIAANHSAVMSRRTSTLIHNPAVADRLRPSVPGPSSAGGGRTACGVAAQRLQLPELPTTTIGSFPQTKEIREARRRHNSEVMPTEDYEAFLRDQIRSVIEFQDRLGLDILVHGEFERNDMVQYFGEQLDGYVFSENGWVQSYGSRGVKPPIIFGDVARPMPMTVRWWNILRVAHEADEGDVHRAGDHAAVVVRSRRPARAETCRQIALALRDETLDLEAAGTQMIQIDEAALREGLPLARGAGVLRGMGGRMLPAGGKRRR